MKNWQPIRTMPDNETFLTVIIDRDGLEHSERRLRREGRLYYPPNTSSIWTDNPPTHWKR